MFRGSVKGTGYPLHLNRRWASVQSTTGRRVVRISGSNAGYTVFRGSVKSTGYPLHSPVSPSLHPPPSTPTFAVIFQLDSTSHTAVFASVLQPVPWRMSRIKYQGADKSLARPGRKQARKHVRDARDFNNIETRAVI